MGLTSAQLDQIARTLAEITKHASALAAEVQQLATQPSVAAMPTIASPSISSVSAPVTPVVTSQTTLTFFVRDGGKDGPPVSGALISGYDAAGYVLSQTTDANGRAVLMGTRGTWPLTISKSGFKSVPWNQVANVDGTRYPFFSESTVTALPSADTSSTGTSAASGSSSQLDQIAQKGPYVLLVYL